MNATTPSTEEFIELAHEVPVIGIPALRERLRKTHNKEKEEKNDGQK